VTARRRLAARRLVAAGAELAEGPIDWAGGVAWVDILRGEIRHHVDGNTRLVATLGEPVGAIAAVDDEALVAACQSGLRLVHADGRHELLVALPRRAPDLRMNDGTVDPAGRFVGGTMTLGDPRPGAGSLWSFAGGAATELLDGLTISNGLAWSADGRTLFHIDTPTRRVDAFDYDVTSGSIARRRTVVEIAAGAGDPDGMCADAEGGLWIALWGGAAVHRYVDGALDTVVEVPTPYVSCPAFVGAQLDRLVITTASEPFGADVPAGAGDVYEVEPGVRGLPPSRADLAVISG
jgi:sugar lactone lactonase YvrE